MENRFYSVDSGGRRYRIATSFRRRGEVLLLLLHGLGCSRASFRDIWSRPDFDDYSIIAMDLPGFGDSSKSDQFSYRMEDHAAVCAGVVNRLGFRKVHIIGHSMGGAIGLLLPADLRNTALTYANLEGNLIGEQCGIISRKTISVAWPDFEREMLPELMTLARSFDDGRFFIEAALPFGFYKSAESLVHWSESGELMRRFMNLPCRKAYFYGQENASMPILQQLPGIDRIMISHSGHFMMNDNPDEFYAHLGKFLCSV